MNGKRADAVLGEIAHDLIRAMLGPGENQRAFHRFAAHQIREDHPLPRCLDEDDTLLDALGGRCHRRDGDFHGIAQKIAGQRADFLRHGRREKQALAILRQQRDDPAQR